MKYNEMRTIFHIFVLIVVVAIFSIINFTSDNKSTQPEIVIVGNDTLGRNWDNLPNAKEIEDAKYNTPTQEITSNTSSTQSEEFESIDFSDRIEKNKGNHQTVISSDGREIIVD